MYGWEALANWRTRSTSEQTEVRTQEQAAVLHQGARRAGQPSSTRACTQASFVFAIVSLKSSSNSESQASGGPPSTSSLLGSPWPSNFLHRICLLGESVFVTKGSGHKVRRVSWS